MFRPLTFQGLDEVFPLGWAALGWVADAMNKLWLTYVCDTAQLVVSVTPSRSLHRNLRLNSFVICALACTAWWRIAIEASGWAEKKERPRIKLRRLQVLVVALKTAIHSSLGRR